MLFYLLLPVIDQFFDPFGESKQWKEITEQTGNEFILVLIVTTLVAFGLTSIIDNLYAKMAKWRRRRTKIGEILVSLNFISEEDLRKALTQQKLKIGEILVQAGRITPQQRDLAPELQKQKNKRIGDILKEQGFITQKDLHWALNEKNKKIGLILKEMNLITDFEIECALMFKKRGRMDKKGKIIDMW